MKEEERSRNEWKERFTRYAAQKIIAALLAGILLFCSFPPLEYYALAWLALIPLVFICFSSRPRESFLYGLLTGVVFWLASIFWLTRVTFIGWFFVSLYCAGYFAVFALIVSWWFERRSFQSAGREGTIRRDLPVLFGAPAVWVGLEYVRAIFLTGFPWNPLGVSQYLWYPLIQCADIGGVYLVSYLVVMGNVVFALLIHNHRKISFQTGAVLGPFLLIVFLALGYGQWRLARLPEKLETIRTVAVQVNVPQQLKWSEEWADNICHRLKTATAKACETVLPDLIVWPETALPDFVQYADSSHELVDATLRHGIPLLIGSMDYEEVSGVTNYYNSSFLFIPGQQEKLPVYRKRHLVLFGEYVPFGRFFPFLRSIADVGEDFTPGEENVVFCLVGEKRKFSVLICFEDTLPYLARECVRAGARLLINQTNDAWFDPYWAPRQHMSHCVFRCIENRAACLRATNTGLTCYINRLGMVRAALEPLGADSRGPQVMRAEVEFSPGNMPLTFYTRHGDLFALACAAFSLPLFIWTVRCFFNRNKAGQHHG